MRFSREDRETLVQYLAKNLGPDKPPRAVRVVKEMPLDESKLGKSMYIEYYLTPDGPGQGIHAPEFAKLKGGFTGRRAGQDVRFDADGNVWLTDRIAIIAPDSGRVTAWLDLAGIRGPVRSGTDDVLNGIAYDAARDRLFVTGKYWSRLFEIRMKRS